jgi:hypothetical protein
MESPLIGREDPVEPALNAVEKDIFNKNVPGEKNSPKPCPFTGEAFGALTVSSGEGLQRPDPSRMTQNRIEGPKVSSISSHHLQIGTLGNFKCGGNAPKFPP